MTYQDDELKPENIRYTLGMMEHTMVNLRKTHVNHQHGLKTHDPVLVIHQDGFAKILNNLQDEAVKDKFLEVVPVINDW